jgi:hypothetical protein
VSEVRISQQADNDLRQIGGSTERWLIGELFRLPEVPYSEISILSIAESRRRPRRSWRVGAYAVVFFEAPQQLVVERVVLAEDLHAWLRVAIEAAERRA